MLKRRVLAMFPSRPLVETVIHKISKRIGFVEEEFNMEYKRPLMQVNIKFFTSFFIIIGELVRENY